MAQTGEPSGPINLQRALAWLGLIFLGVVLAAFLWFGGRVLLMAFAGVLLAVVLRAPMGVLERRLGVPDRLAYVLVLLGLLAVLTGFVLLAGPSVLEQAGEFRERLPRFIEDGRNWLEERPWGRWLVDRVPGEGGGDEGSSGEGESNSPSAVPAIGNVVRQFGAGLADLAFVVVLSLFLSFKPKLYRRGLVRLFPAGWQQRATEVVDELGRTLKYWLVGQLALMFLTGLLTGIGLVILGIPLAMALAFFVGLVEFIPFVGPILGFIPIVLVASAQGMTALLSVTILYLLVQQIEGNILTPLVQQQAVALPPGLTVSAVFLGGALFGPIGVILGTPLMAVLFVLVKMLYVHDVLHQTVEVPGKRESA